jgi:hypothetical protein
VQAGGRVSGTWFKRMRPGPAPRSSTSTAPTTRILPWWLRPPPPLRRLPTCLTKPSLDTSCHTKPFRAIPTEPARPDLTSQAELAQQGLDPRMQCLARTMTEEDSRARTGARASRAGRRRSPARHPPGRRRDDYVGTELSRCHVPRRFRMTTRPSVNAWTASSTSTKMILKSSGSGACAPQR